MPMSMGNMMRECPDLLLSDFDRLEVARIKGAWCTCMSRLRNSLSQCDDEMLSNAVRACNNAHGRTLLSSVMDLYDVTTLFATSDTCAPYFMRLSWASRNRFPAASVITTNACSDCSEWDKYGQDYLYPSSVAAMISSHITNLRPHVPVLYPASLDLLEQSLMMPMHQHRISSDAAVSLALTVVYDTCSSIVIPIVGQQHYRLLVLVISVLSIHGIHLDKGTFQIPL